MSSLRNGGIGMLLSCCNTILNKDEDVPMKNPALSNPLTHLLETGAPSSSLVPIYLVSTKLLKLGSHEPTS